MIVADFAWTKPTVAQLHAWGVAAVGMYVSHDPAKDATRPLVEEYAQAGIKTFLFFEDAAGQATRGYDQGKADAAVAVAKAEALGKPGWAPVLAACDFDIPDYAPHSADPLAKLGPVGEYFHGWDEVAGVAQTGGYGGYWAVTRLAAARLVTVSVQTIAWSGGKAAAGDVAALQNGRTLDGGNVDVELIESGNLLDRLAWIPGEAAPGAHPVVTHTEDEAWLSKGSQSLAALAGQLHTTVTAILETTIKHTARFPAELAGYLDTGNLDAAKMPTGTVVWYPRAAT